MASCLRIASCATYNKGFVGRKSVEHRCQRYVLSTKAAAAASNMAYSSWDWESEDESVKQAFNAVTNVEAMKAAVAVHNVTEYTDFADWDQPICLNMEFGSWDFDDSAAVEAPEVITGPAFAPVPPAMKNTTTTAAAKHRKPPAADF